MRPEPRNSAVRGEASLVDRILARHGSGRYLEDPAERGALEDLVKLLGGYPLPLTVVLPVLASSTPTEVLAELRAGGGGADPSGLIRSAIEYSHGQLDESLQNSLLLLAPFTSVIAAGPLLEAYQELLLQDETVRELGRIDLTAALDRAVAVGLATPHPELNAFAQVQPVMPYFLRSRLRGKPALRASTDQAHYLLHRDLAADLYHLLTSGGDPQQRTLGQVVTRAEYANLTAAVDYGLHTGHPIDSLIEALNEYLSQVQQHDTRRQLLEHTIADYPAPVSQDQQVGLSYLHELAGSAALQMRLFDAARGHEEAAIRLLEAAGNRQRQSVVYHQLGRIAQDQRRFAEAETTYRQALDIYLEFGDRHGAARTYHQLGRVALDDRRFAEAEATYRQALDINWSSATGTAPPAPTTSSACSPTSSSGSPMPSTATDRPSTSTWSSATGTSAASTYQQLGRVAQEQQRFAEAEATYRQALDIFLEFGDRHSAGKILGRLGGVAQEQHRFADAEHSYRQALDIFLEFGDRYQTANIYQQLGMVAQEQQRLAEAEATYRQALDIFLEVDDRHSAGKILGRLGGVAQEQQRFEDAVVNYQKGLDILRDSDRRAASWVASSLGIVLSEIGRHRDATSAFLYAAITWRLETGQWHPEDLRWLNRERSLMESADFAELFDENVPADLKNELMTAMETQ